jgi:phage terminase Nu1 subunit (DNA packaging protein)
MKPQLDALEMTPSKFSAMMNCDRHELSRKLAEIDAAPTGTKNGGKLFKLRDLILAYAGGDEKAERVRKLRAESERLEIQNRKSNGELIEVAAVKKMGTNVMAAIKNKILGFPSMTNEEKDSCLRDLYTLKDCDYS